ncbi:metallophosphoesterase [bacterium]
MLDIDMTNHYKVSFPVLIIIASTYACTPTTANTDKGPYLQNVKPNEATICWESVKPVRSKIVYEPYVLTDVPMSINVEPNEFNEITIKGLRPGTMYSYKVIQKGKMMGYGVFTTAPAKPEPFRFAAYGDCRTDHKTHTALLERMKPYSPAFLLSTGDLVTDGRKQSDWNDFWRVVSPFAKDVPYYPILGNHEHDDPLYYKYFSLPRNGKDESYYAFAWSNVFIIAMDSSSPQFLLADQKNWLKKALKRAEGYDFKVLFFHHPFYSSSKRDPNLHFRKVYEPIFKKYGVDLVLAGHDHFYERSKSKDGITYVITGGGGAGLYGFERNTPESIVRKRAYHFMVFDVIDRKMTVRVIDIDGNTIDGFTLTAD